MNSHLFVYGTLKSTTRGHYGREAQGRLLREAEIVGCATVAGRLLDLGAYPGLVEPAGIGDRVSGEVVRLRDPAPTFAWLDRYEGIREAGAAAARAGGRHDAEYVRLVRPAMLDSGAVLDVWLYLFAGDPRRFAAIPSGDWTAPERS